MHLALCCLSLGCILSGFLFDSWYTTPFTIVSIVSHLLCYIKRFHDLTWLFWKMLVDISPQIQSGHCMENWEAVVVSEHWKSISTWMRPKLLCAWLREKFISLFNCDHICPLTIGAFPWKVRCQLTESQASLEKIHAVSNTQRRTNQLGLV